MSRLFIFGVVPGSRGEVDGYALPLWEDPLPEDAPEDDHNAWDERNPIWGMRDDLDCHLDSDFVEYFGDRGCGDRFAYLTTLLANSDDIKTVKARIGHCEEVVLIFEQAFGPFPSAEKMKDTDALIYCGEFKSAH